MSRTPGRVAFDAFYAHLYLPAERVAADLNFDREGASGPWQAAANAVIEECAKVADDDEGKFTWAGEDRHVAMLQTCASEIAAAIRSLKTSTGEETANE